MILLKSQGLTLQEIADIFGVTFQIANIWIKRYLESGIEGVKTRPGHGGKPILDNARIHTS